MKQIKMRPQSLKVFAWLGICVGIYVIAMGVVMWIRVNQPPYNEEALLNHVSKILEEVKNGKTSVDVASVHIFELCNMFVYMIKKSDDGDNWQWFDVNCFIVLCHFFFAQKHQG